MTITELNKFIKIYQDLRTFAWSRGKQALLATETGFGEKCTGFHRIDFEENYINVIGYDTCYDLVDLCGYSLSFEELLMTDKQWEQRLLQLKEITEENKRIKTEQEKLRKLEEVEKEFFRLKKELGK